MLLGSGFGGMPSHCNSPTYLLALVISSQSNFSFGLITLLSFGVEISAPVCLKMVWGEVQYNLFSPGYQAPKNHTQVPSWSISASSDLTVQEVIFPISVPSVDFGGINPDSSYL